MVLQISYVEYSNVLDVTKKHLRDLQRMTFRYGNVDQDIKELWLNYKSKMTEMDLRNLPIDELSKINSRIPVGRLLSHGVQTIFDGLHKSQGYFMCIEGIGDIMSNEIVRGINLTYQRIYDNVSINLKHSVHAQAVRRKLYVRLEIMRRKSKVDLFISNRNKIHSLMVKYLNELGELDQRSWISYRHEPSRIRAYQSLLELDGEMDAFHQTYGKLLINEDGALNERHFEKYSSMYYALLERIMGEPLNRKSDSHDIDQDASPTVSMDLSNEIAKKVQGLQLDLNHLTVIPRAYQYFGAQFMIGQKRTLIGDEMGLGKTIEALVAMNHLHETKGYKHFVVVAPLSIVSNWLSEIDKWTTFDGYKYHGESRKESFETWEKNGGILVTNYAQSGHLIKTVKGIDMLVVDEAHYVKNPEALRSRNVYELNSVSKYITYMTGTPIENNVGEMIQLISKLQRLDSIAKFDGDEFLHASNEFMNLISPVYLRRKRTDVLDELPKLDEKEVWVPFGEVEYDHYVNGLEEMHFMQLRRAAWSGLTPEQSPKLNALMKICNLAEKNGDKVIVFSFFRSVLNVIQSNLGDRCVGYISGSVSPERRQELVNELDDAKPGSVLISQIDAGGVGLNIQSANHVILCEPQYKPSTENQAISRAYRMGQTKDVTVYRLLSKESIDEHILTFIHEKTVIFNRFADGSQVVNVNREGHAASGMSITDYIMTQESIRHGVTRDVVK